MGGKQTGYHLAGAEARRVGFPADGPQEAVHLVHGADLLFPVLLLGVLGDERDFEATGRFTHRLDLCVLPQVYARVFYFLCAIRTYQAVEAS